MTSSENHVTLPTLLLKYPSLKTVMIHFGWNCLLVGIFRYNPSQKPFRKSHRKCERNVLNFLEYYRKSTFGKSEIFVFIENFKG